MQTYLSHKRVRAFKIVEITSGLSITDETCLVSDTDGTNSQGTSVSPEYVAKHVPVVGGYYVRYDDGYESFSPAAAFEAGYTLVED